MFGFRWFQELAKEKATIERLIAENDTDSHKLHARLMQVFREREERERTRRANRAADRLSAEIEVCVVFFSLYIINTRV